MVAKKKRRRVNKKAKVENHEETQEETEDEASLLETVKALQDRLEKLESEKAEAVESSKNTVNHQWLRGIKECQNEIKELEGKTDEYSVSRTGVLEDRIEAFRNNLV